ncbi:rCG20043, partial [Rattus norvegicus]
MQSSEHGRSGSYLQCHSVIPPGLEFETRDPSKPT